MFPFIIAVLLVAATGCGEPDDPTSPAGEGSGTAPSPTPETQPTATDEPASGHFDGTRWIVTTIDGEPTVPGTTVSVSFADGRISAYAGCNSIGGGYTASDDGSFSTPQLMMTLMACQDPPGVMDQETALAQALDDVESYRGDDTEMEMLDAAGDVRLVLQNEDAAGETIPVEGTTWVLTRIDGSRTRSWPPTTLVFGMNGPVGASGCLQYSLWADYWQDGEFGAPRLMTSDYLCREMDPRGAGKPYFDALETATSYEAREHRLQMMDAEGNVVLTYRRGLEDGELDGTAWNLLSVEGRPAVEGTAVTLEFADGLVQGNGGCNSYGGPYTLVDPGVLSILDVARTEMGCLDQDAMDQEIAYFNSLARATTYEIGDVGLTLFDARGETLLVFGRM